MGAGRRLAGAQTNGMEQYRRRVMEYAETCPEKCCLNCACYCDGICTRMACARDLNGWSGTIFVQGYGVCSKWISDEVAAVYSGCASKEEARLRLAVIGADPVEELDMPMEEKRATPKMTEYATTILNCGTRPLSPFPMEAAASACVGEENRCHEYTVVFRMSSEFWSVWEWLRRNAPAYEAAHSRKRILQDAMMRFDSEVQSDKRNP